MRSNVATKPVVPAKAGTHWFCTYDNGFPLSRE
jgi:hypothetical protein